MPHTRFYVRQGFGVRHQITGYMYSQSTWKKGHLWEINKSQALGGRIQLTQLSYPRGIFSILGKQIQETAPKNLNGLWSNICKGFHEINYIICNKKNLIRWQPKDKLQLSNDSTMTLPALHSAEEAAIYMYIYKF